MKKIIIALCLLCCILVVFGIGIGKFLNFYFNTMSDSEVLKRDFSIQNNTQIKLTEIYNSYSGEGESLHIVDVEDVQILTKDWSDLPMDAGIEEFLYSELSTNSSRAYKVGLPLIKNGKYKYVDRGDTKFNESSAYNFSICILNLDDNKIYYYRIDT